MKKHSLAVLLAIPCAAVLTACGSSGSSPSGETYALEDGVSVTVQAPEGWEVHHEADTGLVWLALAGEERDDPRGSNYITVATRDRCLGDGDWQWNEPIYTLDDERGGEVARRADDGERCVGVHANDTPGRTDVNVQATDLLADVMEGKIVTGATNG